MRSFLTFPVLILFMLVYQPLFSSVNPTETNADTTFAKTQLLVVDTDWLTIEDPAPQLSSEGRIPIIMVHGWSFDGKPAPPGTGTWDSHLNFLINDPDLSKYFKPYYVKYWSNAVTVNELGGLLRDKIELAGLHENPFILLAHSMGGLVSRSFMNEYSYTSGKYAGSKCGDLVKLLITLGTPHHGSPMANGPARDDKVSLLLKIYMSAIESIVFSETKYYEVNRSDLRWDNYDNLLDYIKFPAELNGWLTNLNSHSEYDQKLVCYAATLTGVFLLPPYNGIDEQYAVAADIIKESFNLDNDGIVPYKSAIFEGHSPKKIRFFDEYNHSDIGNGKGDEIVLFTSLKEDLLDVVPPKLVWPSEAGIFLKHSDIKAIRWDAPSSVETVNIYFSGDNGVTFTKLASDIDARLRSYEWSIPDTNLTRCILRITKADDETEYTQTENTFTIYHNRLTFQNPLPNTYFSPDRINKIVWSETGIGTNVKIFYNDRKNGVDKIIVDGYSTSQQTNSYDWAIDHSLPPTDSAYLIIHIQGMDIPGDDEFYSYTSPPFMMLGVPEITALAPSANPIDFDGRMGEKLEIGSNYNISWLTEGEIKFVKISLCDSAKNIVQTIRKRNHTPGIHSHGSTIWKVPELFGNSYFLLFEAGSGENTITTSAYSPNSFRINRQLMIDYPIYNANNVTLLPCLSVGMLANATAYHFEIKDSTTSGIEYRQTYTSAQPLICFPNSLENELLASTAYRLTAWATFDTIESYGAQVDFRTKKRLPNSFKMVAPVAGDTIWDDIVQFIWNRSVGAKSYLFELMYFNKSVSIEMLGRSDTTITIEMSKNGYADSLYWRVTASNEFGENSVANYFFNKDVTDKITVAEKKHSFNLVCFPNPINANSVFDFILPEKGRNQNVNLSIYTLSGQQIGVLLNESLESGRHKVEWANLNGKTVRGIYFAILNVDGQKEIIQISQE